MKSAQVGVRLPPRHAKQAAQDGLDQVLGDRIKAEGWTEDQLGQVKELSLQRHKIERMSGSRLLPRFSQIVKLDLSRNLLTSLEGLDSLHMLEKLNIYLNKISNGNEILRLQENSKLAQLDVRLNPIIHSTWYRFFVIQHLNNLKILDEQEISPYERRKAAEMPKISASDLAFQDDDDDDNDYSSEEEHGGNRQMDTDKEVTQSPVTKNELPENFVVEPVTPLKEDTSLNLSVSTASSQGSENEKIDNNNNSIDNNDEEGDDEDDMEGEDFDSTEEEGNFDQTFLSLLKYVRKMQNPLTMSAWDGVMSGLNQKLVDLVTFRKKEKQEQETLRKQLGQVQSQLEACRHERDVALRETQKLMEQQIQDSLRVSASAQVNMSMEERREEEENDTSIITNQVSIENDHVNIHTQVPAMLLEAHNALIQSNRALLQELDQLKARYAQDEQQWQRNFDRLKKFQNSENVAPNHSNPA